MEVKGKVVIVTGASSGIGEATARQFGRCGSEDRQMYGRQYWLCPWSAFERLGQTRIGSGFI